MRTTTIILFVVLGVVIIVSAWLLTYLSYSYQPQYVVPPSFPDPARELRPPEPSNAVQELTPGTTIGDVEQDLEELLQEDKVLGDVEAQLRQAEQELQEEGL